MPTPSSPPAPLLEIACFNEESALVAADAGAGRIELCRDYALGGLSPLPDSVRALKSLLSIPIYVMIRPHAHHFCYNDDDYENMKLTMNAFKEQGADGFVFGILARSSGPGETLLVDMARNKALVELADGRPCTFHRAFDLIPDSEWDAALRAIAECGFQSILTSGGPSGNSAVECTGQLDYLVHYQLDFSPSRCQRPEIIVGGGVRSMNAADVFQKTRATAFHSAALSHTGEAVDADEVRALRVALNEACANAT
ncbi:Copper homeostasis protein [Aspergillus sp. HF37]|nr:Copper homeostasis protein [Aspergillus sp. HF37]